MSAAPIKFWTEGVQVEDEARAQLARISRLPVVGPHIAVMPDVHLGIGATVGSVIPTVGAIIPSAVGVDIGCGMQAVKTSLKAKDLPDSLAAMRSAVEAAVPHGRTSNGGAGDRGAWHHIPAHAAAEWSNLSPRYDQIVAKHPKAKAFNSVNHLGTLGGGNHFVEVCLDD